MKLITPIFLNIKNFDIKIAHKTNRQNGLEILISSNL